jgi:DNA-binding NtrC family response regulator
MRCLQKHSWDGNVRELENVIERAVIFSNGNIITRDDLPESLLGYADTYVNSDNSLEKPHTYHDVVLKTKKEILDQALSDAGGNVSEAAKNLGVHPNNLHRLINQFELRNDR